ncbi:PDC sensor domain-containing protein [Melioribacter sp. OK-6-Me]|uniref:PDC sensor domain-containing protein n=1 Tax=unclassified Melioribacter TaxID=2627329 RepID=UPI003ED9696D
MKKSTVTILFQLFVFLLHVNMQAQDVPANVVKVANSELLKIVSNSVVVSAVESQNAKNFSLAKIKQIDSEWQNTSGLNDFMKELINNECSRYLKSLMKQKPYLVEIFVTDNKGANVAMSNKTSDYWQGDEDKFTKCFNSGQGKIFYGKQTFDESVQTYVIQVSVPVKKGGITIGTATFGIDTGKLK